MFSLSDVEAICLHICFGFAVTEFAKKTGDFTVLSATDIKVMALTLKMEKQYAGSLEHLNKEPQTDVSVKFYNPSTKKAQSDKTPNLEGFYKPNDTEESTVVMESSSSHFAFSVCSLL